MPAVAGGIWQSVRTTTTCTQEMTAHTQATTAGQQLLLKCCTHTECAGWLHRTKLKGLCGGFASHKTTLCLLAAAAQLGGAPALATPLVLAVLPRLLTQSLTHRCIIIAASSCLANSGRSSPLPCFSCSACREQQQGGGLGVLKHRHIKKMGTHTNQHTARHA